jgi:hypothetical protein
VNQAWRVLQVTVDDYHGIANAMVETGAKCSLVPEVAAEVDNLVVRVSGEETFHDFAGSVLGTIVDKNEFVLDILKLFLQDAVSFGYDLFFIKYRYNYG